MSSKKKTEKPENITEENVENVENVEKVEEVVTPVENVEKSVEETAKQEEAPKQAEKKSQKSSKKEPKYAVGSIVFVSKEADADLNGFKLFPQYKKYTYTVEAYDADTEVYSLRRLNLLLKLKEDLILAPHEKSGSALFQKQY